ncbi:hypothetical protein [Paraburkholderia sp. HP33-1]|uniref:hypothetical protein n=1 Tax=Paraburkholderia sp. HP33-1 TaxID=2883243 RepID=UPI001F38E57A|nr:hypothetical protein [Paraburkholderia sp. HP33-1]
MPNSHCHADELKYPLKLVKVRVSRFGMLYADMRIHLYQAEGALVHRDSKAITLSYNARLMRWVYGSVGVSHVNHMTSIAYQPNTRSALNLLGNLNIFF